MTKFQKKEASGGWLFRQLNKQGLNFLGAVSDHLLNFSCHFKMSVPKLGWFKSEVWLFAIFTQTRSFFLLRPFALFSARLALLCARTTAFRTTTFGNLRLNFPKGPSHTKRTTRSTFTMRSKLAMSSELLSRTPPCLDVVNCYRTPLAWTRFPEFCSTFPLFK